MKVAMNAVIRTMNTRYAMYATRAAAKAAMTAAMTAAQSEPGLIIMIKRQT